MKKKPRSWISHHQNRHKTMSWRNHYTLNVSTGLNREAQQQLYFIFQSHMIISEYQEMELHSWKEQLTEGKLHSSNIFIPFPAAHDSPVIV